MVPPHFQPSSVQTHETENWCSHFSHADDEAEQGDECHKDKHSRTVAMAETLMGFFCRDPKMSFPADQELDPGLRVNLGGKMNDGYTDSFSLATGLMLFNDCFTAVPLGSTLLGSLHTKPEIILTPSHRL